MLNTSADILDLLKVRIEALAPDTPASDDDRFYCVIAEDMVHAGGRGVLIEAAPGRRQFSGRGACSPWETTVTLTAIYTDVKGEPGERSVYSRALADAENILNDLYSWATNAGHLAGILKIDPDLANITGDGAGKLNVVRTMRIEFKRG
jgi:hypothetical protein